MEKTRRITKTYMDFRPIIFNGPKELHPEGEARAAPAPNDRGGRNTHDKKRKSSTAAVRGKETRHW